MLNNLIWYDDKNIYTYQLHTKRKFSLNHLLPSERNDLLKSKEYKKIVAQEFIPSSEQELVLDVDGTYIHNTFKRFKPAHNNDYNITNFIELMNRLFPDQQDYKQVMQFIAHIIQKPEQRPTYGLLLTSESGTGKGFLYSAILRPLLCKQTAQVSDYHGVFGEHATALKETLLVMLDDTKSNHKSTMTKLKSAITEPTRLLNEKGKDPRTINTFSRIILASNEIVPLKLNESDVRRWYAPRYIKHRVSLNETVAFIEEMASQLDLSAIYNYLLNYDLTGFNPYNPKMTDTLKSMLELSKSPLEDEISDYVSQYKVFSLNDLKLHINAPATDSELSSLLTELGYSRKKIRTRDTNKEIRVWCHNTIKPSQAADLFSF